MRITCFITVCACLSSTVSTDEIKHSNRIKKIRLRDELAVKDTPPAINSIPEFPPHLLSILRGSRTPIRIETIPKSKKTREFQSSAQQQQQQQQKQSQPQHRHYNRARSKRLMKRLKVRSIHGASLELGDNHLTELGPDSIHSNEHHTIHEHESIHEHDSIHDHEPIHVHHDEGSIHIEPVLRVTKKHNILDSILDILRQLLHPSKNEPGPLVGPIKIPGSGRKIYLRLVEPVDASQVMVRFITQVPVPTADAEHKPVFHIPPILHPANVLLHYAHGQGHEHHIGSSELHSESSHRYRVVHSPRNYSRIPNKKRGPPHGKPTVLSTSPSKSPMKDPPTDVSIKEPSKNMEPSKTELANTQVKPTTQQQQTSLDPADSYYQYASAEKVVKDLLNNTSGNNDSSMKTPGEPWYQLNTYRLPLRQIAPMYPLSSMEHTDSSGSSYEDTYKVPSDVLTGPSSYSSSSYEHYNTANSASGFTAGSYEQQPYDHYYSSPNSYSTSYDNNKLSNVPSAFSTPYRQQDELNGVPNSYSTSYGSNELSNMSNSYSSETLNDLLSAPSSYSSSYERGTVPPTLSSYDSSFEKQNGVRTISGPHVASYEKGNDDQSTAISHDALRVINPPYFSHSQQPLGNQDTNRSVEQQPRYNPQNINEVISSIGQNGKSSIEHVIWGETKQQKSDWPTSFQKNSSSEVEDSDKTWQPLIFMHENANWHEFDDLIRGAESGGHQKLTRHQQQQHRLQQQQQRQQQKRTDWPRNTSTSERDRRRDQNKPKTTQNPKCLSENENDGCELTKIVTTSTPRSEKTKIIVEEQTTRSITDSIAGIIPKLAAASNAIETAALKLDASAEIPTTSTTSIVTKKPLLLIKMTTTTTTTTTTTPPAASSITEKSLPLIRTTKNPIASGKLKLIVKSDVKEVSAGSTSNMTKESLTESTTPSNTTKKLVLPKRPMIMKKPTLIIKRLELNNKTQKPTTDSTTTKRTLTTRKSRFRSAIARTKSSTT